MKGWGRKSGWVGIEAEKEHGDGTRVQERVQLDDTRMTGEGAGWWRHGRNVWWGYRNLD